MPDTKERGLYDKYKVERQDGKALKGGACIVLEFGDPIARVAILRWAKEMRHNGYKQVYEDTITALATTSDISIGVGDLLWLDADSHWEVLAINQSGDSEGSMSEPVAKLKKLDHERKERTREISVLELKRCLVANPQP